MKKQNPYVLQVHGAVLLFGLSGLFGKLEQPAILITLGRVVFSALFLSALLKCRHIPWRVPGRQGASLAGLGILLAFHWCSFYQAIQLSTVAIGLLTFSSFPIFVTFLEPLFFRRPLRRGDVLAAAITFGGIALVAPVQGGVEMWKGALWGLLSGLSYALLGLLNQKAAGSLPAPVISFYEQSSAAIVLLPALFWLRPHFTWADIGLLALLGTVFTAVSHTLFISGLKGVRAQTAGVISSLEPVYGILFAALFLGEIPSGREILGGLIVLSCALWASQKAEKNT